MKKRKIDIAAYVEIFRLPNKEFIEKFSDTFRNPVTAISPESPSEEVRRFIGRGFSNHALFKSLDFIKKEGVKAHVFFTLGLPGEMPEGDAGRAYWFELFLKNLSTKW